MATDAMTKPLLKWVGGKTQILDAVLDAFPAEMRDYHEPFVGGGSVLIGLLRRVQAGDVRVRGRICAYDANPALVGMYQVAQRDPVGLWAELKSRMDAFQALPEELAEAGRDKPRRSASAHTAARPESREEYYYAARQEYNDLSAEDRCGPRGAALFLFLNKTCFRGVFREGPRGFNVPYGHYANPEILTEAHLRSVSGLIQPVEFRCCDFADALQDVLRDAAPDSAADFVYADPPYAPSTRTSFVGYTKSGFQRDQHQALFALLRDLASRGQCFLLSNSDVPMVRDAFPAPAFETQVLSCRRAIHSKNPESRANEVLVRPLPHKKEAD